MISEADKLAIHDFWSQQPFQKLVKDALGVCQHSATEIQTHVKFLKLTKEFIPTERDVQRMRRTGPKAQKKLNNDERMCGLLLCAYDLLHQEPERTAAQEGCFQSLKNAVKQLCIRTSSQFAARKLYPDFVGGDGPPDLTVVISTIAAQFAIPESEFKKAGKFFFEDFDVDAPPETALKAYFNTYRLDAEPGKIVKSFTVVESPTRSLPACLFYNFFVGRGAKFARRASGIIVPTSKALYFTGGLESGTGMKFMALPRLVQTAEYRTEFRGLMITFGSDETIVGARFAMLKTDKDNHTDAGAGVFPMGKLPEVASLVEELRNDTSTVLTTN